MNTKKIKYKASKLLNHYQELLQLRQQNDPDHCIDDSPFEDLKKEVKNIQSKEKVSDAKLAVISNKIHLIQRYLRQFATFERLQNQLLQLTRNLDLALLQKSVNYLALQRYIEQLTTDFEQAHYLRSGIEPSVQQLKYHFDRFIEKHTIEGKKVMKKTPYSIKDFPEASLFEKVTHKDNYEDIISYMEHNFSPTLDLSASKVLQLKRGYHKHHLKVVQDEIIGQKNKLKEPLELLKKAFVTGSNAQLQKAILSIQRNIKPINIQSPSNYSAVRHKLLTILGTVEANSRINLIVNNSRSFDTITTNAGDFKFEDIELKTGENLLLFFNQDYALIDERKYHLHISLNLDYPFMGLYDPLTQKAFAVNEIDMIVRCDTCGNFMYDFSVEDNDDACTFPKCEGKKFSPHQNPEFWSK